MKHQLSRLILLLPPLLFLVASSLPHLIHGVEFLPTVVAGCNGTIAECHAATTELLMDSEIHRRFLQPKDTITYPVLDRNKAACKNGAKTVYDELHTASLQSSEQGLSSYLRVSSPTCHCTPLMGRILPPLTCCFFLLQWNSTFVLVPKKHLRIGRLEFCSTQRVIFLFFYLKRTNSDDFNPKI
ncbi:unnamed protein product [Musa textilis]